MKARKRFNSERAILAEINECHREALEVTREAEAMEETAKEWIKLTEMADAGKHKLEESRKLRERAARLIDVKAKKLGERLAEFRTEPMALLNGDRSIQQ